MKVYGFVGPSGTGKSYRAQMVASEKGINFIIDDGPDFGMSFAFILGIAVVICCFHTKPIYREIPQYEVIISEDTSFYDIYNNYDVIEQRGEIFILQEKNQNDG